MWVRDIFYPNLRKALNIRVMLVYYKFYYIGPTNWYVINEVIQYSFIILLKFHLIVTLVCKLFVVKFVISLAFSPKKNLPPNIWGLFMSRGLRRWPKWPRPRTGPDSKCFCSTSFEYPYGNPTYSTIWHKKCCDLSLCLFLYKIFFHF